MGLLAQIYISMSSNSFNDFWGWVVIIAIAIVGIMWLFDAGPFEKNVTTPSYNYPTSGGGYNRPSGGGSNPSFTGGSSKVYSRTVSIYNIDGSYCYGKIDLTTDGTYEYYGTSRAQRPSNSPFNYFVSYGGGFAYFY